MKVINYYIDRYKVVPKNIIIYRKSENNRDLQNIISKEVSKTVELLQEKYQQNIKLTVLGVKKKINTRFA